MDRSNAFLTNCRMIVRLYPPLINPAASDGPARGVSIPDSLSSGAARLASFSLSLVASLVLFVRRGGSDGGVPKDAVSSSPRVRLRPTRDVVRSGIGTALDIGWSRGGKVEEMLPPFRHYHKCFVDRSDRVQLSSHVA